jgi:hypothetical protein
MAIARVVTYECKKCGSEIVVTKTGETVLAPIYCCGAEVIEASSVERKQTKAKKKTVKKTTKKIAKKKLTKKTKTVTKKK